jgi:HTH-type transcriptional regulator, transcriptional repressor of NAD biosynthesis genes
MPEHGRPFWEAHHDAEGKLSPEQLVQLAREHREGEEAAMQRARGHLFIDTNALTTAMFSLDYCGAVHPDLTALAEACVTRYDVTVLAGDDIP